MGIKLFDKRYVYLEWSDKLEGKDCILAKSYKDLKDFVNSGDEGRIFKIKKGTEKPFTNGCSECDFCYYDPNLAVKKAFYEGKAIQIKYHWGGKWENWTSKNLPSFENDYDVRIRPIEELYEVYTSDLDCFYIRDVEKGKKCGKHSHCYFKGTYDACYDWVMNHKELYEVIWAWEQGKEIQWKHHSESVWRPCITTKPCFDNSYDLRVKPTETEENYSHEKYKRRMTNKELAEYLVKGNGEMKTEYFSLNALKFISTVYTSYSYLEGTENEEIGNSILIRDFGSDEWREPLIEV